MKLNVFRYNSDVDHTNSVFLIDGKYECDGIEDEYRETKIKHETRIPDGVYRVELRTVGGFHQRYLKKFGEGFHKGMLWVKDVPNFEYILIHILNTDDGTSGCYGVGFAGRNNQNFIANSRVAYMQIYPKVRNALLRGEEVTIEFKTLDDVAA